MGKSPKIHVVDSGLLVNLLKLSADKLQRRIPSAMSEFGQSGLLVNSSYLTILFSIFFTLVQSSYISS